MGNPILLTPGTIHGSFPICLVGDQYGFEDPSNLLLRGELPRGRYRLQITVREAVHNQLLLVLLNGQPIDSFGVPFAGDCDDNWVESRRDRNTGDKLAFMQDVKDRYGLHELYEKRLAEREEWVLETAFAVPEPGIMQIEIRNCNGDNAGEPVRFYHGDGVDLLAIELQTDTRQAPDSFSRTNPGVPMLDAWGWVAYLGFDNFDRREEEFVEIAKQAIHEARAWGANLLEFNPALRDGHPFDFEQDGGPVAGTTRSQTTTWNSDSVRKLFRLAHDEGMLAELFLFSLGGFEEFHKLSVEQLQIFLERMQKHLGCGTTREETLAALDGAIYELHPHDAPWLTDHAWQYNPGASQTVSGGVTGTALELKNNGYAASFANYVAHWVGAAIHHTGYDCLFSAVPYPKEFCQRPREIGYAYLQGCAQVRRPCEANATRDGYLHRGAPGRDAAPDWILAQLQGFAQRRWRDETDPIASLLCWEAVCDQICPPKDKPFIYAVTQDPIRACAAGNLTDTGRGGSIDFRREVRRDTRADCVRTMSRHLMPDNARFLRNQDLEWITFPGKDFNLLNLDLSRSARFYTNGERVRPFSPLFVTGVTDADVMEVNEHYDVQEIGGAICETEQTLRFRFPEGSLREVRRIRMLTDLPGIALCADRSWQPSSPGTLPPVVTGLAADPHYQVTQLARTDTQVLLRFRDSDDVLPEAICRLSLENGTITSVDLENGIHLHADAGEVHRVRLRLLFAVGHIQASELDTLINCDELWEPVRLVLPLSGQPVHLPHDLTSPVTRVVTVEPSITAPCRVREQGWWHYRGITPSQATPERDYLKAHCLPQDSVLLARETWIDNEVTWGWGSQYILLIGDVKSLADDWHQVTVRIVNVTPFIFAPRLQLRAEAAEVELDGNAWHYGDGEFVFLPNRRGDYTLRWRYGQAVGPRLVRTFAAVNATRIVDGMLHVSTSLPEFVQEDPGYHGWYALVDEGTTRKVHPITIGECLISDHGIQPETE